MPRILKKMKKMKSKTILLLLSLFLTFSLVSCNNSRFSDKELADVAAELIESSKEINEIFFGEGLPVDESTSQIKDGEEVTGGNYCRVTSDCPYRTKDEVKEAAERVFSDEYLSQVYESAFEGSDDIRPRYGTDSTGALTRDITSAKKQTDEWTEWNKSTIEIKSASSSRAVFSVEGTFRGKTEREVMQMVYTAQGWRLDSPTY